MIFSIGDHIEMIKAGQKTQTRRKSATYLRGRSYSIQPGRRKPGIPEGRIRITRKRKELSPGNISKEDAWDEGGYYPNFFEKLYREIYPRWEVRFAYTFEFVPKASYEQGSLLK